jgi:hypothetical protein
VLDPGFRRDDARGFRRDGAKVANAEIAPRPALQATSYSQP